MMQGVGHDADDIADATTDAADGAHGKHAAAAASDDGFGDAADIWQWPRALHVTGRGRKQA